MHFFAERAAPGDEQPQPSAEAVVDGPEEQLADVEGSAVAQLAVQSHRRLHRRAHHARFRRQLLGEPAME